MNKKNFSKSAKKIFIWFSFFLLLSNTVFWISFDSKKDFYENFYSNVYNETDYKKKSLKRVADETWLSEETIYKFYNWSWSVILYNECKKDVKTQFCNSLIENSSNEAYYRNLLNQKIESELKIVKLEEKLQSIWEDEEIFSDWDYKNSFFDVVTQWNIIDVILFWKDWMTPFFKYKKQNDKNNDPKNPNQNNESIKKENTEEKENSNETISFLDDKSESESDIYSELTKNWFSENNISNKKKYEEINQICLDPFLLNSEIINNKITSQSEEKISTIDKLLQENNNISQKNWEENSTETMTSTILEDNNITEYWFIEPKDDWKKCAKPLYWWYICLDKSWWKCYPIWKTQEWDDNPQEWENWSFCREILYITWKQDLLWNWESVNCINCYIKKWLQIIEDKIYWEAIYPRPNLIKNWNTPNKKWISRFFSFLNISYKPMPWDKENYKKNEPKKTYWDDSDWHLKFQKPVQKYQSTLTLIDWAKKDDEITDKYKKDNFSKLQNKKDTAIIKDAYFWDVNKRISEFRNLFQKWILKNIEWMPFDKIIKLKSTTCDQIN